MKRIYSFLIDTWISIKYSFCRLLGKPLSRNYSKRTDGPWKFVIATIRSKAFRKETKKASKYKFKFLSKDQFQECSHCVCTHRIDSIAQACFMDGDFFNNGVYYSIKSEQVSAYFYKAPLGYPITENWYDLIESCIRDIKYTDTFYGMIRYRLIEERIKDYFYDKPRSPKPYLRFIKVLRKNNYYFFLSKSIYPQNISYSI